MLEQEQLVAKLRQEIQLLRQDLQTKEKHIIAQKQTNDINKNHLAALRSKNQVQKEKLRQLETSLEAANLQKEELNASLLEAHQKLNELQSRSQINDRGIKYDRPQSIENIIFVNKSINHSQSENNFPTEIDQISIFKSNCEISKKTLNQKQRESQERTSQITITALEQKIKKLQTELKLSFKDNETLKRQISKLENEKKHKQQAVLSSLLPQDSYFGVDKIVENRKQYLNGQQEDEGNLIAPKSVHKSIFKSIMSHLDSVDQNKKMPFLQMLNVWSQQKLQKIYKSLQELR